MFGDGGPDSVGYLQSTRGNWSGSFREYDASLHKAQFDSFFSSLLSIRLPLVRNFAQQSCLCRNILILFRLFNNFCHFFGMRRNSLGIFHLLLCHADTFVFSRCRIMTPFCRVIMSNVNAGVMCFLVNITIDYSIIWPKN